MVISSEKQTIGGGSASAKRKVEYLKYLHTQRNPSGDQSPQHTAIGKMRNMQDVAVPEMRCKRTNERAIHSRQLIISMQLVRQLHQPKPLANILEMCSSMKRACPPC